jgi:16S rRNA (guanine527-N7)-methyltransferase
MFHVKHQDGDPGGGVAALGAMLERMAESLGIRLRSRDAALLVRHLQLVLAANERLNLTRIDDPERGIRLHIVDSLAPLAEVDSAPRGRYADLGSGAGYPGIPLGVAAGRLAVLVESVGKKAEFLREATRELGLEHQIRVYPGRAEALARQDPGGFSLVTARAVAQLASLVELASPLLMHGGVFVAMKGAPGEEEIAHGDAAGRRVGMQRESVRHLVLPDGDETRTVVRYVKVGEPTVELPRADGRAQHRPLA